MILYRQYKEHPTKANTYIDRVWYDSSNIVYSECDDKENELKTLRVVFSNGAMYEYKDVDVNDYIMFTHGGIENSNGKAFFKYIKGRKYEFERLPDIDKQRLIEERDLLIKEEKEKQEQEKIKEEENGTTDKENNVG